MKKLSKMLLIVTMFISTTIILSIKGVKTISEAQANVSQEQVIVYLTECGYRVISVTPKPNSIADWICKTSIGLTHYNTTIYIMGNNIVGYNSVINLAAVNPEPGIAGHEDCPF